MNVVRFIAENKENWTALEEATQTIRQGQSLESKDFRKMTSLYRAATADFAYARTHFAGHEIVSYLNKLVVETHGLIYQRKRVRLKGFFYWLFQTVPGIFARHFKTFLFALGLFFLFGTVGFLGSEFIEGGEAIFLYLDLTDPESSFDNNTYYIERTERNIRRDEPFAVYERDNNYTMTSGIMFNNIRVSIFCFAGGIFFGLVTFWVLAINSMMVGAFFHIFYRHDLSWEFWNTVMIHGTIELSMMVFAATAGFIIAKGMLFPGRNTWGDSIRRAGLHAVQLAIVISLFDGIAAILEGNATGANLLWWGKLIFIICSFLLLLWYFGWQAWKYRPASGRAWQFDDEKAQISSS